MSFQPVRSRWITVVGVLGVKGKQMPRLVTRPGRKPRVTKGTMVGHGQCVG